MPPLNYKLKTLILYALLNTSYFLLVITTYILLVQELLKAVQTQKVKKTVIRTLVLIALQVQGFRVKLAQLVLEQ